jgi:hypothetical protein
MVFYGKPAGAADVSGALNDLERNMGTIAWNIPRETHRVVVNLPAAAEPHREPAGRRQRALPRHAAILRALPDLPER